LRKSDVAGQSQYWNYDNDHIENVGTFRF